MAVTSRELRPSAPSRRPRMVHAAWRVVQGIVIVLAGCALYLVANTLVVYGQLWYDDLRYGRPRTTHLSGFVGREGEHGRPTHLVAVNLDRQVMIYEIPASDPERVRSVPAPYLVGVDESLTPIHMALRDVDHDGMVDLVVSVKREQFIYLNRDDMFRLGTPDELRQLTAVP